MNRFPSSAFERSGRRGGRFLVFSLFLLALSDCGIENFPYLSPPVLADYSGLISLTHSGNSGNDFLGYQILYRLFSDVDEASAAYQKVNALASTSSPDSAYALLVSASYGFCPMKFLPADATEIPFLDPTILPIEESEQATSISFEIDIASWTMVKNQIMYSALRTTGGALKDPSQFAVGDIDYAGKTTGTLAYIVIAAVAVGRSPSSPLIPVYSLPVVLTNNDPSAYQYIRIGQ